MTDPFGSETIETWDVEVRADTRDFEQQMRSAMRVGSQFSNALIHAFEGIAIKGKGVGDVLKSLALSLSQIVLKAALRPLTQGLGDVLGGMIGGGGFAFANGGVIAHGTPVPFANGGVIASPIAFPLAGGATGIAGEKGAEAIMPLARGADGRLGVVAQSGGAANVTINIATPDIESFRRSQGEIAAMITRAAALGNRNL